MTLLDGTVIPPMTRTEAEKKLTERFGCDGIFSYWRYPFAHKMHNGTSCLVAYHLPKYGSEWIPTLLRADSGGFEGAWYMLDRDEAYQMNEEFKAEQMKREGICRQLLYPYRPPKSSFWKRVKRWFKYEEIGA